MSIKDGCHQVSRLYTAEYRNADGRQVSKAFRTSNKVQARRLAIELQQRLETDTEEPRNPKTLIEDLLDAYFESVKRRDVAPKTVWKYRADIAKIKKYCREAKIMLARQFGEDDLHRFRNWLDDCGYAPKTVQGAIVLTKQAFKWAWRNGLLRDYNLAAASFTKAKAKPQPYFTSDQVNRLIEEAEGEERAAFALLGYAGLRIGEVEQLRWEDFKTQDGRLTMIHVRRGGSRGTTKDKDDRFVPVHPTVAEHLFPYKKIGPVFQSIGERKLLKRLKELCAVCEFDDPKQYKLHSFRHHFASLCANHNVAHRKALAWLGHSSSEMLDLYYHLNDDDSQQAMMALAQSAEVGSGALTTDSPVEGNLRATGESTNEKTPQTPELQELMAYLSNQPERAGFEPARQV